MASIGLHGPIYIEQALLDRAKVELTKLALRDVLGDKLGALETIGLLLLSASGKIHAV